VNPAALALLALVSGLCVYDWAVTRRARRMLLLQTVVFAGGAFFIVFPDAATAVAHRVGIGRGVDFILYPLVIWLVRESLLNRRRRWEDGERLTKLVRAQAIATSIEVAPRDAGPHEVGPR
jgi:small membrane protein